MRRQLLPAVIAIVLFTALALVYGVATTVVGQVFFKDKADGSLVEDASGHVVGSRLIGQGFTKSGYFHPRPAADDYAAGPDYSYGSNYGPTNAALIGNVPGVSIDGKTNPYASPSDPYCVPVQATDKDGNPVVGQAGEPVYEKEKDGTYVCDPNTVPQRVLAYRAENHLGPEVEVPVDAVTASGSGLDPHITVANAKLQAPRIAGTRKVSVATVLDLVKDNTDPRALGVLGEPAVNVLELNLALDALKK
jgi:K+-transporting ATPase ATPase C chain